MTNNFTRRALRNQTENVVKVGRVTRVDKSAQPYICDVEVGAHGPGAFTHQLTGCIAALPLQEANYIDHDDRKYLEVVQLEDPEMETDEAVPVPVVQTAPPTLGILLSELEVGQTVVVLCYGAVLDGLKYVIARVP